MSACENDLKGQGSRATLPVPENHNENTDMSNLFHSLSNQKGIFALGVVEKQGQLLTSHGKDLTYTNWLGSPKPWASKNNSGKFSFLFDLKKSTTKKIVKVWLAMVLPLVVQWAESG